jgi:hypothetical protein
MKMKATLRVCLLCQIMLEIKREAISLQIWAAIRSFHLCLVATV